MVSCLKRAVSELSQDEEYLQFDWPSVRRQDILRLLSQMKESGLSSSYVKSVVDVVRCVLRECRDEGLVDDVTYRRIAAVKVPSPSPTEKGRVLPPSDRARMNSAVAVRGGNAAVRDVAIMAILYGAGVRCAELAALDLADIDLSTGRIVVRHGKGDKRRYGYVGGNVRDAVSAWLEVRGIAVGPLFCPVRQNGVVIVGKPITPRSVAHILAKIEAESGVAHFTPHDFRRTRITDLLEAGVDVLTVQKIAGHASLQTTSLYDLRGERGIREDAEI